MKRVVILMAVVMVCAFCAGAFAAEWFVGPDGKAANTGAKNSPWDIISAFGAGHNQIQPGDTIWLFGGTYKVDRALIHTAIPVKLVGAENKPITIKPYENAHVAIDGGIESAAPVAYVHFYNLEIFVTEWLTKVTSQQKGPWPTDVPKSYGGVHDTGGKNCKYINLVVHNNAEGFEMWCDALNTEVYGCLIYDNGWDAPDRGHGHGIYTQNKEGVKTYSNNIISTLAAGGQCAIQAYGSGDGAKSYTNNFLVTDNISFNAGQFLIGGGRPSGGLKVHRNYIYAVPMWVGYYWSERNDDCDVRDNYVGNSSLNFFNFDKIERSGNVVINGDTKLYKTRESFTSEKGEPVPAEAKVVLLPNKYEPTRANLAIFNWKKEQQVEVSFKDFLKPGDEFRVMDSKKFFGDPVFTGAVDAAGKAKIPVTGEFAAYVVLKTK
jgi:hypothetical protein